MRHIRHLAFIFTILALIIATSSMLAAATRGIHVLSKKGTELYLYKDYYALVVGVGNYDYWPDLRGSVKDAREVAGSLKKMGMNVTLLLNPHSQELKGALDTLTYEVGSEKNRAILFFFSGHGETETLADGTKLGFIIPKDAPLPSRDRIGFNNKAISMSQIERYALTIRSKHVLMLFDSCFSGSVFASLKGAPTDITEKSNRPVRQFITAGNEDEQVPDESVFKTCFVQGINGEADANRDGYVTGSELGLYLDSSVVNYSRGCQHPQYGKIRNAKLDKGDFIIKLADAGAMATLSVRSSVPGSRVFIDGIEMGKTPLVDFGLSAGDHRIRVEKEGYEPWQKDIHIDEDRSLSLDASLTPIRSVERPCRLYVDTEPRNARIRILNIGPRYQRGMELNAGRYHIEVSAPSYETKQQWIDLAATEDKYIDIRLEPERREPPPTPSVRDTGQKTFTNSVGMKFVLIPNGTFMMGSPSNESGRDNDETQHRVTISKPYYLQTTEVTQGQWKAVMGSNPLHFRKGDDYPVEEVSWNDVQEFITKLNRKENTNKYRLPTEAEWEYACRAGNTARFSFGDDDSDLGRYAWYFSNSSGETHQVAQKEPNAWGLYDMHGNVWEWCQDWYGDYPSGHVTDQSGPSSGSDRVLRGGSWCNLAGLVRSAFRLRRNPGFRYSYGLGFRFARDK